MLYYVTTALTSLFLCLYPGETKPSPFNGSILKRDQSLSSPYKETTANGCNIGLDVDLI